VAFKINGTFLRGTDWVAKDMTDLNPNANVSTGLTGGDNPAYDPVNSYGNESPNRRTLSLAGKDYVVARTGYAEKDVIDYNMRNLKGDVSLSYAPAEETRLTYTYRFANLDNVYQRANRFRLDNYQLQQHGLSFLGKTIQLRAYLNMENTGESYNARSMAENMDRDFKSDNVWFADYSTGFNTALNGGSTVADAHHLARAATDTGRPQPGSEDFLQRLEQLGDINNWDYGAALRVRSRMLQLEGQFSITDQFFQGLKSKTDLQVLLGAEHRTYMIIPDGNYFINPTEPGENLLYGKTGMFLQASGSVFRDKLKLGATMRADKNEYFPLKWNPRLTMVYSPVASHNIRFSYQTGYRFPSVFEAFSNVNSGGVKRVGGLPVMSSGIFESAYKRTSVDAFQAAVNKDVNTLGITKEEAIIKNQDLLIKNDYTYLQPEHIQSLEVGYRSEWLAGDLQLDVDFYYNRYEEFIGQVEMNIPKTEDPDSIPFYLYDKNKQDRYRMWTNSKTIAYNYGSSMGIKVQLPAHFQASGNVTLSRLQRKSGNDGLEDGFNTPQWMTNFSLGNDRIFQQAGFMITYHWQCAYDWQSFLVSGKVPAYQTVDAQLSYLWGKVKLRVGGTNVLNRFYTSYLGGPSVGGFYYTSLTFTP
jgi:iron complex outermembrane receptor protein